MTIVLCDEMSQLDFRFALEKTLYDDISSTLTKFDVIYTQFGESA